MEHGRERPQNITFDNALDLDLIQLAHFLAWRALSSPSESLLIPVIFDALNVRRKTACISNSLHMIGSKVPHRQSVVVGTPDRKV